jgi:hypothetical protein
VARRGQHRVEVGDLPEAVAAELQRRGHEPETPLADVERGPAVVVGGGVPVRDDHLGEGEPVRDRPEAAAVDDADGVQDQPFPVVEAQSQPPVLPGEQVAVERERDAVGLADVQRLDLPQRDRDQSGPVLAHHRRQRRIAAGRVVFEVQQFHPVEVDDRMQPRQVMGVGAALLTAPAPDVGPAQPQAAVALRHQRRGIGPHVGEH